ncbi:MAG: hypothetical protein DRJ51_06775 [Thermoprotei archaeon]|nr:MAG: hypothetical protein DRJ51_06775 [Thermoprotei archaeon]RLF02620.1 MAG: hypothetical protein DRJ59_03100 [Thermoprotei archaeon]
MSEKELAKLGDAIVNLLASAILTLLKKRPVALKVPNDILSDVYRTVASSSPHLIKKPSSVNKATCIEAHFARIWLQKQISIDELIADGYEYAKQLQEKSGLNEREIVIRSLSYLISKYGK